MVDKGFLVPGQVFPPWRRLQDQLAGPTFPWRGRRGRRCSCGSSSPRGLAPIQQGLQTFMMVPPGLGVRGGVGGAGGAQRVEAGDAAECSAMHRAALPELIIRSKSPAGASNFLASLGHIARRVVLSHI